MKHAWFAKRGRIVTWQSENPVNCKAYQRAREDGLLSTNKGSRAITTEEYGLGKWYARTALCEHNLVSWGNYGNATVMGKGYAR